jgi:hypothetical protein
MPKRGIRTGDGATGGATGGGALAQAAKPEVANQVSKLRRCKWRSRKKLMHQTTHFIKTAEHSPAGKARILRPATGRPERRNAQRPMPLAVGDC